MNDPSTYCEWFSLLENFGRGDDSAITLMQKGTFVLDAGTAMAFYTKVEDTYNKRKKNWIDKLNKSFMFENLRTENDYDMLLRNAKINLKPLVTFITLQAFPADLQNTLRSDLISYVSDIKKSLKEKVDRHHPLKDKLLIIINNFDVYTADTPSRSSVFPAEDTSKNLFTTRKIIF